MAIGIQAADFRVAAAELYERTANSVVSVGDRSGGGAGVVLKGGLVITNDHVARRTRMGVSSRAGEELLAPVVARDRENDLAALFVGQARWLYPIALGDSSQLEVGQLVFAVGHPLGWSYYPTAGIVTAKPVQPGYARGERGLLKLDVSLAPGNSGGPIVDTAGRVVGVACMIAGPGLSLAVPSAVVAEFVKWAGTRLPVAA